MRTMPFLAILLCAACDGTAFQPQQQPPKQTDIPGADVPSGDTALPDVPDPGSDPDAAADEAGVPDTQVAGCMDPEATNHDPAATTDDGSCLYDVELVFRVDMSCRRDAVAPQVAGGNTFGRPGVSPLEDPDQDGIWTRTFRVPTGLGTSYTFAKDACVAYTCKERIGGQSCATDPNDDRYLAVGTEDVEVQACFGVCDVEVCGQCPEGAPAPDPVPSCASPRVRMRFRVDLADSWSVAQDHVISLQGDWASPGPGIVMTRLPPPLHTVYEAVACLDPDSEYLYRFAGYEGSVLEFADGAHAVDAPPCAGTTRTEACGETTCTHRILVTGKADLDLPTVDWAGCPAD